MNFRKMLSAALAGAFVFTCWVSPASAIDKFKVSDDLVTSDDVPTLSFDMDDWKNYVTVTDEGKETAGMKLSTETDGSYQGASLLLSADFSTANVSSTGEEDQDPVYGIEITAESMGLENFNGCTIMFRIIFDKNMMDKVENNSCFLFGADEDGNNISKTEQTIKIDTLTNINSYSLCTSTLVASETNAKAIYVKVPFTSDYSGSVFMIDNFTVILPDSEDRIHNLDGYNASAKVNSGSRQIKAGEKSSSYVAKDTEESNQGSPVKYIIVGAVLLLLVGGGAAAFIIHRKNRFY